MSLLKAQNISKSYKLLEVVKDISLEINSGEVVGLLGPNGAGKTTAFYIIVGLVMADKGSIFLDDKDITQLNMHKRASLGLGYLPQEASIFRKLTVEENILSILEYQSHLTQPEREQKLDQLIEELHISHVKKNLGINLSGGERRRVEIARALAADPRFILLDEPFAGVDPIAVEEIQGIVHSLKEKEIGVLITDHNVRETLSITDRSYLLFNGQILKSGSSEFLANDDEARRLYLGEKFKLD